MRALLIFACAAAIGIASVPLLGQSSKVRRIDVLIALYTRSFSQALTREQIERVHEEVLEFVDFYQTAAGDAVDFRISLLQIDRQLALSEVAEVAPGRYYLSRENIEAELVALDMLDYEFDEVIALYAWNNANPDGASLAYGGGAVGPDGHFLGDAGFNSIGVFAWDPGRISQIMIHEVLHNIDDMFSMSGMPDGFLNSDEMSRNMPTLLAERPGAFLPHYDDDEMTTYAQRELENKATYPWAMQLVYYRWMLERVRRDDWMKLEYGRIAGSRPARGARPLYDKVFLSRANDEVYLPVVSDGDMKGAARVADGEPVSLARRTYRHTDFDGGVLFEGDYLSGWVSLPDATPRLAVMVGDAASEIHRVGMGDIVAPPRIVTYQRAEEAGTGALVVELREARFGGGGPLIADGELSTQGAGVEFDFEQRQPGHFVAPLAYDEIGARRVDLLASAPGLVFIPRAVQVENRHAWSITSDDRMVAGLGTPFDLTLRIARDRGAEGAKVTATIGSGELLLEELADGQYSAVLDESLAPGLDTIRVRAELPGRHGVEILEREIPIYVEPRGWIEVPPRIDAEGETELTLEARVRDRMGRFVEGAGLRLGVVFGSDLVMMNERDRSGVYEATIIASPGEHRAYVIGLDGSFERRVVALHGGSAGSMRSERRPIEPGTAVAPSRSPSIQVDGVLDEWDDVSSINLDSNAFLLTSPDRYEGDADISGAIRITWDTLHVYVAGRFTDDALTPGAAWTSDRINLVFDFNNDTHPLSYGGNAPDASRWQVDDQWVYAHIVGDGEPPFPVMRLGSDFHGPITDSQLASVATDEGWTFEMQVPWAELPEARPFVGAVFGLQLFVSDGDGGGGLTEIMWSDRWAYTADAGLHWELWKMGRLILTGAAVY